jgi:hypothetical protein
MSHRANAPLFLHANGKVSRRLPLPWRVRLRLRATRRVNVIGCWLVEHGQFTAAEWLWRVCRMW